MKISEMKNPDFMPGLSWGAATARYMPLGVGFVSSTR